jgi:peptidoglycan/xylan/chitin deacetylase (PgdA/CDA1 family)
MWWNNPGQGRVRPEPKFATWEKRIASKREIVATCSAATGVTRLIESLPHRSSLLILNYHRIGEASETPYDPELFSCTAAEFDWQVGYLASRFPIVTLHEALEIVHDGVKPARTVVLLTFDDGYRDNYDAAYPILRKHQASATFFLPTAFIGTGTLPWWDRIAYIVKRSTKRQIALSYPSQREFDLSPAHRDDSVVRILSMFRGQDTTDTERFIKELEQACESAGPSDAAERCFMNWEEAREMQNGGMCFGSHTHTHPILSKLSADQQFAELRTSRDILERELGGPVDTLAYPVGGRGEFGADTFDALRRAQYRTAFSFYSGINYAGDIQPFDVLRNGVDSETRPLFRLRTALRTATGHQF